MKSARNNECPFRPTYCPATPYLRLRDARKSVVPHAQLLQMKPGSEELLYDIRSEDGQSAIGSQNIYSREDYRELYRNIRMVFYPRMFHYHPSMPTRSLRIQFDGTAPPRSLGAAASSSGPNSLSEGRVPPWETMDESLAKLVGSLAKEYGTKVWEHGTTLAHIQHATARNLARESHYHRAVVFSNDLVRALTAARPLDVSLFDSVPTPEKLKEFGDKFTKVVENQRFAIIVQAEQAGVLLAAGLEESATALWRSIVAQYRLYTAPMLDIATDYGLSYGFAMPPEVARARADIERYIAAIEAASGEKPKARGLPKTGSEDGRASQILDTLDSIWAAVPDKAKTQATLAKTVDTTLSELLRLSRSPSIWSREKRLFLARAPGYVYRSPHPILSPARLAPALAFDSTTGFVTDFQKLFDTSKEQALEAAPLDDAGGVGSAAERGLLRFLRGWYWLDQKEFSLAKGEFTAAAEAYLSGAKGESAAGLLARRNAIMMLVAAAAITETPVGVDAAKTDFLDGLDVQSRTWLRSWYAAGLPSHHAEAQGKLVTSYLRRIRQRIGMARSGAWDRYFFVDYRFRFGAIPDVVVADALRLRLFETVPRDANSTPVEPLPENPEVPPQLQDLDLAKFLEIAYPPPKEIDETILNLPAP